MGAGRKTQTSSYDSANRGGGGGGGGRFQPIPPDRDLREALGGVIFGATADTIRECVEGLIFGLPERHMTYVEYIEPGCPIFLFNYTDKKMHGIFEATCSGQLNINPHGWTGGTVAKTRYPAQVRVAWYARCTPLPESVFKPVIEENYYADRRFLFELTAAQATNLCALFRGRLANGGPSPARSPAAAPPAPAPSPARQAAAVAQPLALAPPPAAARQAPQPARQAPAKQAPAPPPAAAPQPLAAPPAAAAAYDPVQVVARTHATAAAALARAEPGVTQAVSAHLEAYVAAFAALRVQASDGEKARAEADAMRAELEALRAHVAGAPPSPTPRQGTASASAGSPAPSLPQRGLVFTLGGNDSNGWTSAVEVYTPHTGTWEPVSEMPGAGRGYSAAATLTGASGAPSVLVVGGGDGANWYDSADAYDVATGDWRPCAPLAVGRGSLAAVALCDAVYVFGGGHSGESANTLHGLSVTERYDAARDAWLPLAPMSCGRFAVGGAALGGALYAAGGFSGTSYLDSAERFDPREGVWRPLPPMPAGVRGSIQLAAAPGSAGEHTLVAAGGFRGNAFLDTAEAYDARANSWRSLTPLLRKRAYGVAVAVDGRLILLGGLDRNVHLPDEAQLEEYDAAANVWRTLTLPAAEVRKRSFIAAAVVPWDC